MKNKIYFSVLTITMSLLSGCNSPNALKTFSSSGAESYQISCGGLFGGADTSSCYYLAGKLCGKSGYTISHTGANSIIATCKSTAEMQPQHPK